MLQKTSISPTIKNQINEVYTHNFRHEGKFKNALFIIIGRSSLGPQLLNKKIYFIGNPDQDGIDSILEKLYLRKTLMFVKSKSGSTSEPRNAMKEVEHDFYKKESN